MIMEQSNQLAAADGSPKIRCAVYSRYSSDLQRPASSEDQIRNCRAGARENGWIVLEEFIRSDEEQTGRTMIGREGLADLMRLAKQRPKLFDCILIDDTSRLGRYLPDVLRECDTLMLHDVFIYFVSDRLDSRDESFRIVHLVKGYGDERYSKDLAKKIHRGQEGCIRKGYTAGSSCYGYKNRYLRDPNQKGDHGETRVIGVEQEKVPEQAAVVVRIMEMRASGFSFSKISKTLNADGVLAPRRKYKGRIQEYWVPSSIKEITKNQLYHGVRLWNRTHRELNPSDGTKIVRTKPQSEWVRVEVPELQIVPEELWEQVQQVNQRMKDKIYGRRQGGFNRSQASRTYLFSGLMTCGLCGGKFCVIIGGDPSKVRYGCRSHRFRNTCTNKVTILRSRLEQQFIAAISQNLLDPRLDEQRRQDFSAQLKAAIELEEKLTSESASNAPKLKAERSDLEQQAIRLVDAIGQHGYSSFLSAQLSKVESRMAEIDRLLTVKPTSKRTAFTDEQIAEFLRQESRDFCDALAGDAEFARREIQKRIRSLVLTPKETAEGPVLDVSGDVALLGTGDVLVESPMEGIAQHYISASISLAGVSLDPSLPLAA
jgi:DNA invertase Pin-like site-specific DNA recombinase